MGPSHVGLHPHTQYTITVNISVGCNSTGRVSPGRYLLALNRADSRRDGKSAGSVHAVFGQCEGLVHGQAGHVGVEVAAVEAHAGGGGALDGAAAAFPGVLAVVPVGRLTPARRNKRGIVLGLMSNSTAINTAFSSGLARSAERPRSQDGSIQPAQPARLTYNYRFTQSL